jgi:hypothetical protein
MRLYRPCECIGFRFRLVIPAIKQSEMEQLDLVTTLKLSLQRALLGAVSENIYAITADVKEKQIRIHAFYYREPSESELNDLSMVTTEVIADFPTGYKVDEQCFLKSLTDPIVLNFWVFMRK